jgi:hypothetical protein
VADDWLKAFAVGLAALCLTGAGCRRSGMPSTFPAAGSSTMAAGTFITAPGVYEWTGQPALPGQFVDYRLSIGSRGKELDLHFYYETRSSPGGSRSDGSGSQPYSEAASPGWFFYVEKPGCYWYFDGRDRVHLHGKSPLPVPTKSIIRGSYVNRDNPPVPPALLARLPRRQRELLSPPDDSAPRPDF